MRILRIILCVNFLASCGNDKEEEPKSESKEAPILGSICTVEPKLRHLFTGKNVCVIPKSTYPGLPDGEFFSLLPITPAFAKKTAIYSCEQSNALDYGYLAGPGKSCFDECTRVAYCLYPVPAP